jgi:hypothetical protein
MVELSMMGTQLSYRHNAHVHAINIGGQVLSNHVCFGEQHFCFKCWKTQVITSDSGIKMIFEQECVSCPNDQSPILARLENILELDYGCSI